MTPELFKRKTRQVAIDVIRLVTSLPRTPASDVIGRQLMKCGTSIGANYRAACRARSRKDMIAKLKIVEEEADETLYWLDLLVESDIRDDARDRSLGASVNECLAMVVASIKTLRAKNESSTVNRQSAIRP